MPRRDLRPCTILALAVPLLTNACAQGMLFGIPNPAAPEVQFEDDQFERSATFVGVDSIRGTRYSDYHRYFLRSWVDKDDLSVSHQLYVAVVYRRDWHFFRVASSQDAVPLELTQIASDVESCSGSGGCILSETFGVDLSDSVLRAYQDDGYAVKFGARSGAELIVTLSPAQIAKQLAAVEAYVQTHR